jgi:hypothetical protein
MFFKHNLLIIHKKGLAIIIHIALNDYYEYNDSNNFIVDYFVQNLDF